MVAESFQSRRLLTALCRAGPDKYCTTYSSVRTHCAVPARCRAAAQPAAFPQILSRCSTGGTKGPPDWMHDAHESQRYRYGIHPCLVSIPSYTYTLSVAISATHNSLRPSSTSPPPARARTLPHCGVDSCFPATHFFPTTLPLTLLRIPRPFSSHTPHNVHLSALTPSRPPSPHSLIPRAPTSHLPTRVTILRYTVLYPRYRTVPTAFPHTMPYPEYCTP